MDKLDQDALKELTRNARESQPKIAKKLRISREVLHYRLKRLEQQGYFFYFSALDIFKIAEVSRYFVGLKYELGAEEEQQLLHLLKENPSYNVGVLSIGSYDLRFSCIVKKKEEIYALLSTLERTFKDKVLKVSVLEVIEQHYFRNHFLGIDYVKEKHFLRKQVPLHLLDKKDKAILRCLFLHPLIKMTDIAARLHFSVDTVHRKVRRLFSEKIVTTSVEADFLKLGMSSYLYMADVKLLDQTLKEKIVSYGQANTTIKEIFFTMGEYNVLLNFVVRDTTALRAQLNTLRRFIGGVRDDNLLILAPEQLSSRGLRLDALFK
mgnify:CR=1 FL=1